MSSYDRELVEQLIPTIFDREYAWGMVNEREADKDMPKAKALKNRTATLWAHLADIRRAWRGAVLTQRERQTVLLCGGVGHTFTEAGEWLGIDRSTAQVAYERGVGRMVDYLNGTSTQDYEPDGD